jgi:hypothetical protein
MSTNDRLPIKSNASQPYNNQVDIHKINVEETKIRVFLVTWIAFIMTLILLIFAITRDTSVLATITIFAAALTLVFTYYFRRKKE